MKKIICFIIVVISIISTAIAENAIYIYRNDGEFNAFLDSRVDSIGYSYISVTDGVKEEKFDKQIIYTPNGRCEIPLSAIDSVVFTERPEPELKDDLFHLTAEHLPYLIGVDSLTLTFSLDIPENLLPAQGSIIVSDVYDVPLTNGFYGKASTVNANEQNIIINCSEVALNEIFENLVCVGTIVSVDNNKQSQSISTFSTGDADETFELNTFTHAFGDVVITDSPSVVIDYCFLVENGNEPSTTVSISQSHEISLNMTYTAEKDSVIDPVWVDTVLVQFPYGQTATFAVGAYLESSGEMEFKNFSISNMISGYLKVSNKSSYHIMGPSYKPSYKQQSVAGGYMQLNGDIEIGGLLNIVTSLISKDSIYNGLGVALSAKYNLNQDSVYSNLLSAKFLEGGHSKFGFWQNNYYLPSNAIGWGYAYLVPSFQPPTYTIGDNGTSVTVETIIEKQYLFMAAGVGIGLVDNATGLSVDTVWCDTKYLNAEEFPYDKLTATFDSLIVGRSYTAFPVVSVMGLTMGATPELTFTLPESVTAGQEVDLGLSVNWAGWNLGASSPTERGNFYAWGETSTKSQFDTSTYKYYSSSSLNIGHDISGTSYDAAFKTWGGEWRMPTTDEFEELLNCTWTKTTLNGVQGYKVTGPNGNSIFFPNTGHKQGSQNTTTTNGYYWTSNGMTTMTKAYCLSTANGFEGLVLKERYWGLVIRPVKSK